jgi:predicted DNA binding CopG/RHH family protein
MKKNKAAANQAISPEEALQFLEDIRKMSSEIDEPTEAISLRVPGNVLRAIKLKAKADGQKYQSLMIEYLRKGLRER